MKRLALALLLLTSCESAKFQPWLSYTDTEGENIGINETGSRFVNNPQGSSWTIGLGFEFPMGPASPQIVKFNWPDLPPRYELLSSKQSVMGNLGRPIVNPVKPESTTTDEALKVKREIEAMSSEDKIWLIVYLVVLLSVAYGGVKVWKMFKSNGKDGT